VLYGERDVFDSAYLDKTVLAEELPQTLIDWYKTPDGQGYRNRLSEAHYVKEVLQTQSCKNISK
jgi:hypothetical protein